MKESDIKIISALRTNSRQTLTKISKKTNVPVSTIYDRIKIHDGKILKKHTTIIDFPKIGYNIRLHMMLKIANKPEFNDMLRESKNVNSVFRVEGDFDFILDCIFKEMSEMQEFMCDINNYGIEMKQVHFVTDEILRENFMN